jgi:pilus assembly protein Flp/PilA
MMALYTRLLLKLRGQSGQGLVEYGLVLVLVSVAVIGALMALSGQINTVYDNIVSGLQGSNP